ncbi:MAG: 8-oxoguanine DNA glycosylase [Candidatus Thorarchaeota archaeon]|nr:8-oxoguanine DNA glycosylase [Candidatus Thorarchaeota archaeon]
MKTLKAKQFDLEATLNSGQTFNWIREGKGYICSDNGQVVYVEQNGNKLLYESSHRQANLKESFRLDDPLLEIQQEIAKDQFICDSIRFSPDLRIVRNPFYPCLISFICSIRKNIPTIRGLMQSFREMYGPQYEFRGRTYYGFPAPEQVAQASVQELRSLGLGWRAKFVSEATAAIVKEEVVEKELVKMKYEEAHRTLKTLHGVGNKVADCICLLSLGFLEAFPIDIWIERAIQERYDIFTKTGKSYRKKSEAARSYFGRYAGYAQEYLFNYTRLRRITTLSSST